MPAFGSKTGPIYPLGLFTVAVIGTVIPLSTNVPLTDAAGTAANPSPLKCASIKVMNASATGNIFLCFNGTTAAANNGTGVILHVPPLQERTIESNAGSNQFSVNNMSLDTDAGGTKAYVTLVVE
jgi:hypothetical protein